jgi:ketosteroid isomerase-like protein
MSRPLTAVEHLEIERACERLVHAYVRALDDGDMNAAADCFAENGSLARPSAPDQVITGREAIRASLLARPRSVFTCHLATSVMIDVEGPDSARGSCYLTLFQATRADGAAPPYESNGPVWIGRMRDRFVRERGRWKFLERRGSIELKYLPPSLPAGG